jgi:ubiquinone/menaquinone biosynthesis C-methylase UbiE
VLKTRLTIEPAYFDEYNQPCYPSKQAKGLREEQSNELLARALADGYVSMVAETLQAWVARQVSLRAGDSKVDLLEIGGGAGGFFDRIEERVSSYINVEPSRIALVDNDVERLANPRYACIKCSAEGIPLPDESVDIVLAIASFDHIPDYRKGLLEVSRLLRKNGIFVLTLNNRRSWWKLVLSKTNYLRVREEKIAKEHYFQWSFVECARNLSEYVDVSRMSTITFLPYVPYVWKYLLPVSDILGKPLLRKYGSNILALCQKRE